MTEWEKYQEINNELKKDFLCIPPYRCVTGAFVGELFEKLQSEDYQSFKGQIITAIYSPFQRAYQMEYRYKHCKAFKTSMHVIEFATYDALIGNWVCAYLSLLPVIETIMRQWYEEVPELSYTNMFKAHELYGKQSIFSDDRKIIPEEHIKFLKYILEDVLYIRFEKYRKLGFSDTFNRNLSLHQLEGISDVQEGLRNLGRLFLVLDIIAELYFMQTPMDYWTTTFYAEPDKNLDFQLHFCLYRKAGLRLLGPSDLNVIHNTLIAEASDEKKHQVIENQKLELSIMEKLR